MIAVELYTHTNTEDHSIVLEKEDLRVVGVFPSDYVSISDLEVIYDVLCDNIVDCDLDNEEWYQFRLNRIYEDDGSGARNQLWFEIVDVKRVTTVEQISKAFDEMP